MTTPRSDWGARAPHGVAGTYPRRFAALCV